MADIKSHSTLPTNLVAYFDFEENSGTRYDLFGSNNLTDNNTVARATGKIGGCADFEKANSESFTIADNAALSIIGNLSISCWLNIESLGTVMVINGKYSSSAARAWVFYVNTDGTLGVTINQDAGGSDQSSAATTNILSTATWYHVTFTFNASTGVVKIYINGTEASYSSTTTNATAINDNSAEMSIGKNEGSNFFFDGLIDEMGIWTKVLTSGEITDLYNSGNALPYYDPNDVKNDSTLVTSLTSYWKFEETSGTRNDSHGTNHLTDNNTVLSATGKINNGADFESANSEYFSITDGSQTGLDNLSNASFSFWVKLESDTDPVVLGKFATGSASYWIQLQLTTIVKFQDSSEGDTCQIALSDLTLGTWYHMVFTYAAGVVKLYVNGVYIGTDTTSNSTLPNSTGYFSIGRVEKYNSNYFDGVMDEVAIWSKALTVAEVRALYGYGTPPEYEVASAAVNSGFLAFM